MLLNRVFQGFVIVSLLVMMVLGGNLAQAQEPEPLSANVSTFATGLVYPRGLEFGSDGSLYVAEVGPGGNIEPHRTCPGGYGSPVMPYQIGMTGQVSKISPTGERTMVVKALPAARDKSGDVIGPNDVAFLGDTLYVVCSPGMPNTPTAALLDDDYEPDGGPYELSAVDGITLDGQIRRVLDMPANEGHITLTALTFHDGAFYISSLGEVPIQQGTSKIYKVTLDGQSEVFAAGLTAVLGLAFDSQGQLYALEASTVDNDLPVPGAGRVVRVDAKGALEAVATGLSFPGGLTFGPDGQLYVSNFAYGGHPSKGEILRIDVTVAPATLPTSGGVTDPLPGLLLALFVGAGLMGVGWRLRGKSSLLVIV
ncbi:MAG: hypothetical protein BroJett011_58280 [Chloroflexota bacterium]|nr:MAG: hypothetical protein BroJett011_58280 [Chloroflexota bacterium]